MTSNPDIRDDIFSSDPDLLSDYMAMLDWVLALPEIGSALEEQGLTRGGMRNAAVAAAEELLQQARPEYERYRKTLGLIKERTGDSADRIFRAAGIASGAPGLVAVVAGVVGQLLSWTYGFALWLAGLGAVLFGGFFLALALVRREGRLGDQEDFGSAHEDRTQMDLHFLRDRLLDALSEDQLLAFIRTQLNEARGDRLSPEFRVTASPGLSEVYKTDYHVSTGIEREMAELTVRLAGGSVGIAGSRGSGKSTLIRSYCEPAAGNANLCCTVSAPVDYAARDFVLHLFATFCQAVDAFIDGIPKPRSAWNALIAALAGHYRRIFWLAVAASLLIVQWIVHRPWLSYVAFAILVLLGWTTYEDLRWGFRVRGRATAPVFSGKKLRAEARKNLLRVRYLQTRTAGWSGSLTVPGGMQAQRSGGRSWAEQPLSYPEVVERFRAFAGQAAEYAADHGLQVFIGVDELDKIGTAEQAEKFLNEIKGIFGVPHVYFLVSVSDDALTSFERRGLPLRDVFDSSFDEIIRVEPLAYEDSRRLLYRRVVGLNEPYIALCHCLSGGLARDLIRAARVVVRIGQGLPGEQPVRLADVCTRLIQEETRRKAAAVAKMVSSQAPAGTQQDLLSTLHAITNGATDTKPTIELVDMVASVDVGAAPEIARLRLDLAGYLYLCATLEAVFGEALDERRMRWATGDTDHPGHFDRLARAKTAFAQDTRFAWRLINEIRDAWTLPTCDPP